MKIEDQVCSMEIAKRLKNLGVKQESYFFYEWYSDSVFRLSNPHDFIPNNVEKISAFTASELLNMTPQWIDSKRDEPFNNFSFNLDIRRIYVNEKLIRVYAINYICDTVQLQSGTPHFASRLFDHQIRDEKPADAFAKNIIHLHEKNFLIIGK